MKNTFFDSSDLVVREMSWQEENGIVCYYSSIAEGTEVNKQVELLRKRAESKMANWGDTATSDLIDFKESELIDAVCSGAAVIVFPESKKLLKISAEKFVVRSPEEPINEHVVRGSHEGFVESFHQNMALIRKRLAIPDLIVKTVRIGTETKISVSYVYVESEADKDVVNDLKSRLEAIDEQIITNVGQIEDYLEESVWSPFPQFLNTERPDRVVANLMEGKIAIITDHSPTVLLAPITFFTFLQSPDDFNGRVIVGTFYRLLRIFCMFIAIFLPAFYIAVVSFHSEILPIEISTQVKLAVNEIPYRPLVEALILEVFIEVIREASIRLPTPIGQTIGVVGGLVVGDAIVNAGLVSNIMVIVVAMTAISSFVVPSVEMNMTVRILRFPFMLAATLFGFFGMAILTIIIFIHLLNLTSLKQPYFSPVIPFDPSRFKNIFFRLPFNRYNKQEKQFSFFKKGSVRK